ARRPGHTGIAMIAVDAGGENQIVAANGVNLASRASQLDAPGAWGTTLVLQMETEPAENWAAIRAARGRGVRTVLNVAPAAPVPADILALLDVVVVNRLEAAGMAATRGDPMEAAHGIVAAGAGAAVVTLGAGGAIARTGADAWRVGAAPVEAVDTVGAGDSFVGALAAALDGGAGLAAALHRGAVAGSLACRRRGAQSSIPEAAEIDAWLGRLDPPAPL
ncbi:MAG: ribokinase, partial [Alphaproteobacteria bacterium]|nr:ribokinase [Alphaproteobacteria bacterium]